MCRHLYSKTDTATVKFTASDTAYGHKHYWYFGDGTVDSSGVTTIHRYATVGDFTVKHIVYNPVNACIDSTIQILTINRIQNCLIPDFTYTADPFYTNILSFTPVIAKRTEVIDHPEGGATWTWGDGTTNTWNRHVFDSAKVYNVCLFLPNRYTGCVAKVCKPVSVEMETVCNADFQIRTTVDSLGFFQSPHTVIFNGRPQARSTGKRNSWIINGNVRETGNSAYLKTSFFEEGQGEAPPFDLEGNSCYVRNTLELNVDSLQQNITHVIYDSITQCADTVRKSMAVPRAQNVFITAIPHPAFPQYVSFYAYTLSNTGDSIPYNGRWRISGPDGSYYAGGYNGVHNKLTYTFRYPGTYKVGIAANSCVADVREVYYINHTIDKVDSCPIFPPDFYYTVNPDNPRELTFYDRTANVNVSLENSGKWYFGDGDSSRELFPVHVFKTRGNYTARLVYTNPNGCSKEITQTVAVQQTCDFTVRFTYKKDSIAPARIHFTNRTSPDTATLHYTWYFGTGDSATTSNPTYLFRRPGTYTVKLKAVSDNGCEKMYDTAVSISKDDSCMLKAAFTYAIDTLMPSVVQFVNTSTPVNSGITFYWEFGDGDTETFPNPIHIYQASRTYHVSLTAERDSLCKAKASTEVPISSVDNSLTLTPNPARDKINVQFTLSNAGVIYYKIYNQSGLLVKNIEAAGNAGLNKITIPINDLSAGFYVLNITSDRTVIYKAKFLKIN